MDSKLCDRREFYARLASLLAGLGVAVAAFGSTIASEARVAGDKAGGKTGAGQEENSRAAQSIHHGIILKGRRKRRYQAPTKTEPITKGLETCKEPYGAPATISP